MDTKEKKTFFSEVPAWALSIITAIVALIFLFAVGYPLNSLKINGVDIGDWVAYISTGILIAIACFLICKSHPKSVWYVPVICNGLGILAAFVEPSFWTGSLGIQNLAVFVLSIFGSIIGAATGRRNVTQETKK